LASCQNQNNPISEGLGYPLLGIDVWEHAFYVDYLNRKKDYVNKFLNYVNWDEITNRYFESEKSAL
jgi:Fe-Mn family superoxide dismutase